MPSRFREVLSGLGEARLILTTGLDSCVVAYPLPEWNAFEARLSRLPQFDESVIMLRRIYVSGAVECEVDKLGRLLIPSVLRKHGDLQREVLWAGMGPNIELWDKERYETIRNDVLGDPDKRQAMARRLADLGL